ncbi:MAG: nucleotidyltransferase family protein [Lachnospiraceae bacterium]|nr:nucleotidyltransferase family protein [Lachnospiraceae bacterium]
MSTVGIIAEYNPFHTGHAYQIAKAKEITGADHVLVIMSGDFVQRGAPAVMDKYLRTRLALEGGADCVLELPVWMATASAADFAEGAVSIFHALGCVDYLCFGSESGELPLLERAAELFLEEPPSFRQELKRQLSQGKSFPKARKAAWETASGENGDFLDLPNNILGISYLTALKKQNSSIRPVTVPRKGSFHSTDLDQEFASASALRAELLKNAAISFPKETLSFFPGNPAKTLLMQEFGRSYPMDTEHFWMILKEKLLSEADHAELFADFPKELANRLKSCHFTCTGYQELAESLKTAAFTRSRIDRGMIHILLNIRQEDINRLKKAGPASCVRVLGFRKSHAGLLKKMTLNSRIPVLTKALPPRTLSEEAALSLEMDTRAANLYETVKCLLYPENRPVHEYRQKIIVI